MWLLCLVAMAAEPVEVDPDLLTRDTSWSLDILGSSLTFDGDPRQEDSGALLFQTSPRWGWSDRVETRRRTHLLEATMASGVRMLDVSLVDGRTTSLQLDGSLGTEQRAWFDLGRPVFVGGRGIVSSDHQLTLAAGDEPFRRYGLGAEVSLGTGVGRVLELGPRTRAEKMSRILVERGTLRAPLDEDTLRRVVAGWYTHRNRLGSLTPLLDTEAVLRESGLLAEPFSTEESYIVRNIIDDARTAERTQGTDLGGWVDGEVLQFNLNGEQGRTLEVRPLVRAGYHRLLSEDEGVSLQAEHALVNRWQDEGGGHALVGGTHLEASWYRAFFGRYQDSVGTLSLHLSWTVAAGLVNGGGYGAGQVRYSNSAFADTDGLLGHATQFGVSWLHRLNRGCSISVSGSVAYNSSELLAQFLPSSPLRAALGVNLRFGTERGRLAQVSP